MRDPFLASVGRRCASECSWNGQQGCLIRLPVVPLIGEADSVRSR